MIITILYEHNYFSHRLDQEVLAGKGSCVNAHGVFFSTGSPGQNSSLLVVLSLSVLKMTRITSALCSWKC